MDLTRAQTFYIYKVTKIIIIDKNQDLILATFQIVAPGFKILIIAKNLY